MRHKFFPHINSASISPSFMRETSEHFAMTSIDSYSIGCALRLILWTQHRLERETRLRGGAAPHCSSIAYSPKWNRISSYNSDFQPSHGFHKRRPSHWILFERWAISPTWTHQCQLISQTKVNPAYFKDSSSSSSWSKLAKLLSVIDRYSVQSISCERSDLWS